MSEVKSIFGDLQIEEAKDDEEKLVKTLKDFIENSEKLTSNLIYEDDRHKNNQRWFSSKRVIQNNMSLCMMYELLIETLIEDYKESYGITSIINKIDSFYRRLVLLNKKTIEPYLYLIDIQECEKELLEFR
tara:strand:- start:84 stop:476 length:393 start_codon:yes stop_codon:yes gene_type:complete